MKVELSDGTIVVIAVVHHPVEQERLLAVVLHELLDGAAGQSLHTRLTATHHALQPLVHVTIGPQPPGIKNGTAAHQGAHGLEGCVGEVIRRAPHLGRAGPA